MKKIIILCLLLCGCTNYSELNKLALVTAISIDKEKENYKVSVLIANSPKSGTTSKEGEAKTTVYEGKGKTISQAIKTIDKKSPKELYFSHINVLIISKQIGKEGILKISDWFMRNPEIRDKFYIMQIDEDKASDALKIISPLESFPSQSIATLIESSKTQNNKKDTSSFSSLIGKILEKGYEPTIPTIKIEGNIKKGSKQSNLETAKPNTLLSLGPAAIYKKDKYISTTTKKETEIINILNNETKELIYKIKYKNKDVNIFTNLIKSNIKYKNKITINIYSEGNIDEINGYINIKNPKTIKNIEKIWNNNLKKDIKKLVKKTQNEYKSDIFGFGNLIYKNNPKKYKKNYLKNLKIDIKVKTKIISSGSINNTIKEGEKWKK